MTGSLECQFIRLEVVSGKNIQVPSFRIPAGIYVSIKLDSRRRWKSALRVLSSDSTVAWGDTLNISPDATPKLSLEIRASFELGRTLGHGKLIGKFEPSWDELLDHGDEPFDLSFPPIDDICPSLTLKVALVYACGTVLLDLQPIVECKISRRTDAGHTQLFAFMKSESGVSHLDDAVNHFKWVVTQCPVGHPDHAAAITNLACAHLQGYICNYIQYIDTMIPQFRDALALRPQGHPDHPLSLYHLITALTWCYSKEGTINIHETAQLCCKLLSLCPEGTHLRSDDPSDEGIRLRRLVLELCPLGQQRHPSSLHKLSLALARRFEQYGGIVDIDESIRLGRDVLSLCPEGYPGRDTYLNDLATSLQCRFSHERKSHDLDEAISLCEEALRLRPLGHEFRYIPLINLGVRTSNPFPVSLAREALTLCPPGLPKRDATLSNLATILHKRYDEVHVSEDINEAISLYRTSLRSKQPGDPEHHRFLNNLSSALCSRFSSRWRLCHHSTPTDTTPTSSYERPIWLVTAELQASITASTQGFPERIWEAIEWARQAEVHQHESALEAYHTCLDLFDKHVMTRSSIIERRNAATAVRAAQLSVNAASCAIRRKDLKRAVELEERGRGQQWSLASRLRTPLDDLESASLPLAQKFSELSKRLSDAQGSTVSTDPAVADRVAIEYRILTTQWEATLAEIQNLDGFSRFLLPPSYEDLQAAACHGPGSPTTFPFLFALADIEKLKDDFAREIRQAALKGPTERRTELRVLLRRVWDGIMLPIVNVLQRDFKLQHRSRIWLCPTAAFTSIPLHAAHPFRTKADRSGRESCLEDLYVCSYTPTLSALIRSRQTMKVHATPSFVAIGQGEPGAEQGKPLNAVDSELELVRELIPAQIKFTRLSGEEATQAGALEALRCNTWVHLACHGKQDRDQPYYSRFAMRDKPLTLLDIMENDAPQAEFAFLSACHTAVGDEQTPDEVIHLAAGLQFSGFKSVIGTLWAVDDAVAKHVVEAFYEKMFEDLEDGVMDCTKAALALNAAKDAVKKKVPLEQRIVFIHIGV
ncbi:CHAT domain-containing protein [Suillus paluster]|uniref:CHAT domain-containing protein n=1 Tax=Suillus paluster TaxID=48578 RepID=UPI001B88486B|nr:CHAT domain-containing protein [Suillus paluster]KAG1729213.1 CHAT domain-containing protein [Suillus paluster]